MGRRTRVAAEARRSPSGQWRALTRRLEAGMEGAKIGAVGGGFFAACALLVGAARMALWLLRGGGLSLPAAADVKLLVAYVLAFVVGGTAVGFIHGLLANRLMTAVTFMGAGALLMNAIAYVDGGAAAYDRTDAIWMTAIGCVFGLAAAWGVARKA